MVTARSVGAGWLELRVGIGAACSSWLLGRRHRHAADYARRRHPRGRGCGLSNRTPPPILARNRVVVPRSWNPLAHASCLRVDRSPSAITGRQMRRRSLQARSKFRAIVIDGAPLSDSVRSTGFEVIQGGRLLYLLASCRRSRSLLYGQETKVPHVRRSKEMIVRRIFRIK